MLSCKINFYVVMYSLCRYICIFEVAKFCGQRIIHLRPTFAASRAANLGKKRSLKCFSLASDIIIS